MGFIGRWLLSKWFYGVIIAAVLAFLGGVYQTGYNAAWRKAEVETMQTRINTLEQDLAIKDRAAKQAEKDVAELEEEKVRDAALMDTLRKQLANTPRAGLTQSELVILRELATP